MRRWLTFLVLGIFCVALLTPEIVGAVPRQRRKRSPRSTVSSPPPTAWNYGAGLSIGSNSGLSLLAYLNTERFVHALVSFGRGSHFTLIADYAYAFPRVFADLPSMTPYYGYGVVLEKFPSYFGGGGSTRKDSLYVGGRVPLGVQFMIAQTPLQIAVEIAPGLFVVPATYAYIDGSLSLRVLF